LSQFAQDDEEDGGGGGGGDGDGDGAGKGKITDSLAQLALLDESVDKQVDLLKLPRTQPRPEELGRMLENWDEAIAKDLLPKIIDGQGDGP